MEWLYVIVFTNQRLRYLDMLSIGKLRHQLIIAQEFFVWLIFLILVTNLATTNKLNC